MCVDVLYNLDAEPQHRVNQDYISGCPADDPPSQWALIIIIIVIIIGLCLIDQIWILRVLHNFS